jgi:uncharacterized membrane protein
MAGAVQITYFHAGKLGSKTVDDVDKIFKTIPMKAPAGSTETFNCKVWIEEAVKKLAEAGILKCANTKDLRKELQGLAEENDDNTIAGKGYLIHTSKLCT